MKTFLIILTATILFSACQDENVNPVDGNKNPIDTTTNPIDTTTKPIPLDSLTPQEKEMNYNQMIPIAVGNEWTFECTNGEYETMRIDEVKMREWEIELIPIANAPDTVLTLKTYRTAYTNRFGTTHYRYYYVTPNGLWRGANRGDTKRIWACNYLPSNPRRPNDTVYTKDVQILWWNPDFKIEFDGEMREVWDTKRGDIFRGVDLDGFAYQRYVKGIGIIQSINSANGPYPDGELVTYKLK